jgi:ferric-dicitrate binding protein FerR (iron transport regulator)
VWQPVENRTNSVRRYHLPDGSTLWLHPYSCLHYVADFEQSPERIVSLEGEGFFDVVHNSARPFIIQTGHIQTKVLGTAFNMEAYGNENTIRISLVRGKVAVTNTAASDRIAYTAQLTAGHILVYNKQQQTRSIDTLMKTNSSQWTDGTMVLRNIPVADALQRVAKRYGLQLVYTKNIDLEGKNVNGVFKEQTLDEMLHIILFVSGYQYRLTGKMIEIYKK